MTYDVPKKGHWVYVLAKYVSFIYFGPLSGRLKKQCYTQCDCIKLFDQIENSLTFATFDNQLNKNLHSLTFATFQR